MSLVSNIGIDLLNKTATLTVTQSGNPVETITYNNILNQVTFSARGDIVVNGVDFLNLLDQINMYQNSISSNFGINMGYANPFSSINAAETNNSSTWNLVVGVGNTLRVINYIATLSGKTVDLVARSSPKILEFPEWIYIQYCLGRYKNSVKNFLSL